MNVKEHMQKLPFWEHLSIREKEYISSNTVIQQYSKGDFIHDAGNSCLGMAYVLHGMVRVYLLSEEGREITLFRLEKGMPCVLSAACVIHAITFETHMVAERDCSLLVVNSIAFQRLSEGNIYVRCFMYEILTERFSSVMWTMQQILFAKFDQRLAGFFVAEYERTGKRELHMTHEQIAQHVNSAREVVARMLKRFAADGLVEITRGCIFLKDPDGLREI